MPRKRPVPARCRPQPLLAAALRRADLRSATAPASGALRRAGPRCRGPGGSDSRLRARQPTPGRHRPARGAGPRPRARRSRRSRCTGSRPAAFAAAGVCGGVLASTFGVPARTRSAMRSSHMTATHVPGNGRQKKEEASRTPATSANHAPGAPGSGEHRGGPARATPRRRKRLSMVRQGIDPAHQSNPVRERGGGRSRARPEAAVGQAYNRVTASRRPQVAESEAVRHRSANRAEGKSSLL